ncbi:hypothetical protein BD289DRAFT_208508 [Coniella lustricola]|uniref:Uncharacterized protein n=1 Tax=Coniella lustricola TaxID=2025994 RepID=A0A2T3AC13_9PEZI|nr:hypothetical protein BD289DRAFT_208508 [Coniella lustricola]
MSTPGATTRLSGWMMCMSFLCLLLAGHFHTWARLSLVIMFAAGPYMRGSYGRRAFPDAVNLATVLHTRLGRLLVMGSS